MTYFDSSFASSLTKIYVAVLTHSRTSGQNAKTAAKPGLTWKTLAGSVPKWPKSWSCRFGRVWVPKSLRFGRKLCYGLRQRFSFAAPSPTV